MSTTPQWNWEKEFDQTFELHDVGKEYFTICRNSLNNPGYCDGGISVENDQLESAKLHLQRVKDFISLALQQERLKTLKEIITLRSAYVYDDYSSLYQQSGKIWAEYAEVESKYLNKEVESLSHQKENV